MVGRILAVGLAVAVVGGVVYGVYTLVRPNPGSALGRGEAFVDDKKPLPPADEFEALAKTDPVRLLDRCLAKYLRLANNRPDRVVGYRCTLEKTEWVEGSLHGTEQIQLAGRDTFSDDPQADPKSQVRMIWDRGAKKAGVSKEFEYEVKATLLVEVNREEERDGRTEQVPGYEIRTYRPTAPFKQEAQVPVNGSGAKAHSRYCMRDAGLYRGLHRTYLAWKDRAKKGELKTEYLGKRAEPKVGGRVCYVIRRTCSRPEVDPFEVGGQPSTDVAVIDRDGHTEVTVLIDAELWLQVGTIIRRTDVTPERLIGEYYYRDIELNPVFPADTFTPEGTRAAVK